MITAAMPSPAAQQADKWAEVQVRIAHSARPLGAKVNPQAPKSAAAHEANHGWGEIAG